MKKHALKIFVGLYIMIFAGLNLYCFQTLNRITELKNKVETESQVLRQRLDSGDATINTGTSAKTQDILNRLHDEWTRTPNVPDGPLPDSVLMAPTPNG